MIRNPKKILLIEDQVDIRNLIKLCLHGHYYEIHEASDATLGLNMAHAIKPDLVILDIMLPTPLAPSIPAINDGLDLCARLKSDVNYAHMPIILLSAKGQVADKALGMAAGATAYIVKPFSPIHLIQLVEQLLPDS
jgi:DNA-binding response OmpR family regulator